MKPRLRLLLVASLVAGLGRAGAASTCDYRFDGTMSREVLESYLSRAISMEGLLNGIGDLDDNIRMLKSTGAKFIGRSLCLWGREAGLTANLERARQPCLAPVQPRQAAHPLRF